MNHNRVVFPMGEGGVNKVRMCIAQQSCVYVRARHAHIGIVIEPTGLCDVTLPSTLVQLPAYVHWKIYGGYGVTTQYGGTFTYRTCDVHSVKQP